MRENERVREKGREKEGEEEKEGERESKQEEKREVEIDRDRQTETEIEREQEWNGGRSLKVTRVLLIYRPCYHGHSFGTYDQQCGLFNWLFSPVGN